MTADGSIDAIADAIAALRADLPSGATITVAGCVSDAPKVKGPASYFPSIERTYGQPIDHWLDPCAPDGEKHMDTVNWLKSEHGLGHGHANAIVAYVRAE